MIGMYVDEIVPFFLRGFSEEVLVPLFFVSPVTGVLKFSYVPRFVGFSIGRLWSQSYTTD